MKSVQIHKAFLTVAFIFAIGSLHAQGIQFFQGTWKEALAEAKKQDKLLFVDAYAKWCGPCKVMAANTFTSDKVGAMFNANFINLKIDMEETDGRTFGDKYPVSAYPTLFFLDGDGKVVKKLVGGKGVDQLIADGQAALAGYDRSAQFEGQYQSGDRSPEFITKYIAALNASKKESAKIANEFFREHYPSLSESEKSEFLWAAVSEADSKIFETLVPLKSKMIAQYGVKEWNNKITKACEKTVDKAIDFEMTELLDEAILKAKNLTEGEEVFAAKAQIKYYGAMYMHEPYLEAVKTYVKKAGNKSPEVLHFAVECIISKYKDDPIRLAAAEKFAADLIKVEDTPDNYKNYAMILWRTNQKDKAISTLESKIKKLKKDNDPKVNAYENTLEMLKRLG